MLKRYGDYAEAESARRADELGADGDDAGVAVWRRIIDAIGKLASITPRGRPGQVSSPYRARKTRGVSTSTPVLF